MPEDFSQLYVWVDEIPLSRPKRNIARDFSDGVLMAEVIHHFYPRLVELHNYSPANGVTQKQYNWNTLAKKVFVKLKVSVSNAEISDVCNSKPGAVERVLDKVRKRVTSDKEKKLAGDAGTPMTANTPVTGHGGGVRSQKKSSSNHDRADSSARHGNRSGQASPSIPKSARSRAGDIGAPVGSVPSYDGQLDGGMEWQAGPPSNLNLDLQREVDTEILVEKEQTIQELRDTVEILETKVRKLEQLVRLKDARIQSLTSKLSSVDGV